MNDNFKIKNIIEDYEEPLEVYTLFFVIKNKILNVLIALL
jgi:hypothetical protein